MLALTPSFPPCTHFPLIFFSCALCNEEQCQCISFHHFPLLELFMLISAITGPVKAVFLFRYITNNYAFLIRK